MTPYESEMMTRSEQVAVTVTVHVTPRGTRAEEKGGRYATWVGGRARRAPEQYGKFGENSERSADWKIERAGRGRGQRRGGGGEVRGAGEIDGSGSEAGTGATSQTPYSSGKAGIQSKQGHESIGGADPKEKERKDTAECKVSDPSHKQTCLGSRMTRIKLHTIRVARDMAVARTLSLA